MFNSLSFDITYLLDIQLSLVIKNPHATPSFIIGPPLRPTGD